jgi:hypothetical protein
LTVAILEIPWLTICHYIMFTMCFRYDPKNYLRYTSSDFLPVEDCTVFITDTWDFYGDSHKLIPVNMNTISDWFDANHRTVESPFNLQLNAAGFVLHRAC